jgi:CheY-like chemotaxis protein
VSVRVLLVEDEGIIRMMTTEMLEEEGFEVVEARDGDEAVRLLDQGEPFDVLFTDVQMPGILDGIGVAMHIRKLYPTIPVLVVSGYAAQLTARLGALNPPAVFLDKPYDMDDVVSALTRLTAKG